MILIVLKNNLELENYAKNLDQNQCMVSKSNWGINVYI